MKRISIFLLLLSFACAGFAQESGPRYISLAPATTEILCALGLEEELVGVSSYCDYPPGVENKQKIGSFSQPNIELILSLRPDYIFCTGLEQAPIIAQLRRLGLKVSVSDPGNIEELYGSILGIGEITGRVKEARSLIKSMKDGISSVEAKLRQRESLPKCKVFIEIWYDPLTTAGQGSFIDEIISRAGGVNIAHDTVRAYSVFNSEAVIQRNPDCIIFAYMDGAAPDVFLRQRAGWDTISAVKKGRLYNDIDPNILLRPGPRIHLAIKEVYTRLYER